MSRFSSVTGSLVFLLLAPGVVAGLIPWWISGWRLHPPFWGSWLFRLLGVLLLAGGTVLLDSFVRFALQGRGTPAPILPTQHLVITGCYRFVRNPMYVAVSSMVFGQALLLGDVALLKYAALIWLGFHIFVIAYEEPTMRRTFPAEYGLFHAQVPRWIPRLTARKETAR